MSLDKALRLVAVKTDPARLPADNTFCWWDWSRVPNGSAVPTGATTSAQPVSVANPGRGKMWPAHTLRADRPNVAWPVALRWVQAWLHPSTLLWR